MWRIMSHSHGMFGRPLRQDHLSTGKAALMIGALMRLYRRSPFHPRLGTALARGLGVLTAALPSPQIREVRGIRWELDLREVIDASLFFSGSFEPRAEAILAAHLRPGMTAIDVGANIGYHSIPMAKAVGAKGRVVAIEPAPRALARLQRNLALNDVANVSVVASALGDQDVDAVTLPIQSSYPLRGGGVVEPVATRLSRLDTIVAEQSLGWVDLVKIDVDGQEARVLRGARGTLERFRPSLFFEITPSSLEAGGDSVETLFAGLLELRYRIEDESGRPWSDPVRQARAVPAGSGCNLLAVPTL